MKLYQVDAFTDQVFGGNPAGVCIVDKSFPEDLMQKIALENNLSETAFLTFMDNEVNIRWFTPQMEIDLCGHATLASAHVLFHHLQFPDDIIRFRYAGGILMVKKDQNMLSMDFPAMKYKKVEVMDQIILSLNAKPIEVYQGRDLLAVFPSTEDVLALKPDFEKMLELDCLGIIATAPGEKVDFVSRFFAPKAGINEDPVTGSAHCMLAPFWAGRLKKNDLVAEQLSKRKGVLYCKYHGDRVEIAGNAITYLVGDIIF